MPQAAYDQMMRVRPQGTHPVDSCLLFLTTCFERVDPFIPNATTLPVFIPLCGGEQPAQHVLAVFLDYISKVFGRVQSSPHDFLIKIRILESLPKLWIISKSLLAFYFRIDGLGKGVFGIVPRSLGFFVVYLRGTGCWSMFTILMDLRIFNEFWTGLFFWHNSG